MLRYNIVKQRNALDKDKKEIYYTRLTKRNKYSLQDIAREITDRTSLSRGDIISVLVTLEDVIPHMLKNGRTVDLGDLGSFSLQSNSEIFEKKEDVSWRSFKNLKARFRPGKALKISLGEVKFKRV